MESGMQGRFSHPQTVSNAHPPILAYPFPDKRFMLDTDDSKTLLVLYYPKNKIEKKKRKKKCHCIYEQNQEQI